MAKWANGEGSIRKRTRARVDGLSYPRYSAVITTGYGSDGTQMRLEGASRNTQKEAFLALEKLRDAQKRGTLNGYTTVADYLDYWLSQIRSKEGMTSRRHLSYRT